MAGCEERGRLVAHQIHHGCRSQAVRVMQCWRPRRLIYHTSTSTADALAAGKQLLNPSTIHMIYSLIKCVPTSNKVNDKLHFFFLAHTI